MELSLTELLTNAAQKPDFVTFTLLFGGVAWWLLNRGVVVPGAVSQLLVKIAKLEVELISCDQQHKECKETSARQDARIDDLEERLMKHLGVMK
jgi:outer membrane murein-binding lipoprotein Lpp